MTPSPELTMCLRRVRLGGLAVAIVGGAAAPMVTRIRRNSSSRPTLPRISTGSEWRLGCMGVAMLHGLTGGAWGLAIRRVIEAGYQTLPLLALLFAPLWFNVGRIYEWADPEVMRHNELLARKAGYLNVDGFQTRAIVYFAVWIAITWLLNLSSPNDEPPGDTPRGRRLQGTSGWASLPTG